MSRIMIADLTIGKPADITLVVQSATPRLTKAKKPYLALTFFDGVDTIAGNYWDWAGVVTPDKNTVLNIKGQCSEWVGVKQLNINAMHTNTETPLTDFAPSSGAVIDEVYADAYALMNSTNNEVLRSLALHLLEDLRPLWCSVPGAKGVHHAYLGGTLIHSLSVAMLSRAIALQTPGADVDLCTVGGMLHDIGKLFTYSMDGVIIGMTDEGMEQDHLFIGAELIGTRSREMTVQDYNTTQLLRHIILSHHGTLEFGAVVTPLCIEAHIVHHADTIDAAAEQIRVCSAKCATDAKWTERIWALNNRPHMTVQYVSEVVSPL